MREPLGKRHTRFLIIILIVFSVLGCSITEQPVSAHWETQLQNAYEAARSHQQDVLLTYMRAIPRWSREESALPTFRCTWQFLSPSTGKLIAVRFEDADIPDTTETNVLDTKSFEPHYAHPLTTPEQERLKQAVQSIKVNPAEAYQKAIQDGLFFGDKSSFTGVQLLMEPTIQDHLGIPAVWRVSFANETATKKATIWIDPTTGDIVGHTTDRTTIPTAETQLPPTSP